MTMDKHFYAVVLTQLYFILLAATIYYYIGGLQEEVFMFF